MALTSKIVTRRIGYKIQCTGGRTELEEAGLLVEREPAHITSRKNIEAFVYSYKEKCEIQSLEPREELT